jgi:hypothetical protein
MPGQKKTGSASKKSYVAPEPLPPIPKYKPKNGHVARQGSSVLLYGPIRLRPAFQQLSAELGVVEIRKPATPSRGPAPSTQIVFKNWQAAERFFGREFSNEDPRESLLRASGSPNFTSPSMDRAFSKVAEKLM